MYLQICVPWKLNSGTHCGVVSIEFAMDVT